LLILHFIFIEIPEDLYSAKNNFEALNQQLLEELPICIQASTKILYTCISIFIKARKLYNGKIMKEYLNISEVQIYITSINDFNNFIFYKKFFCYSM
jgi:hypothetical protein